jgi:hypothetical protein
MSCIDISDAYRAVHTHPDSREFLGLAWDFDDGAGVTYLSDTRMCMGLRAACSIFNRLSDFVVVCAGLEGVDSCVNYLDDFCVVTRSYGENTVAQGKIMGILRRLGFHISFKKVTNPSQLTRFLGIDIDSVAMSLSLPADKLIKLINKLQMFNGKNKSTKLELDSLAGLLAHASKVVRGGRTFTRRIYDLCGRAKRFHHSIRLNNEFRLDLKWWLEFVRDFNGTACIIPPVDPVLCTYSDASFFGFSATFEDDWLTGSWSRESNSTLEYLGHHLWESDGDFPVDNINVLEMYPILAATRRWGSQWRDRRVCLITDNTQVMSALNTGRSRNKTTMKFLREIFWCSVIYNFEISSVYISTHVNVVADALSRLDLVKSVERLRLTAFNGSMCCYERILSNSSV